MKTAYPVLHLANLRLSDVQRQDSAMEMIQHNVCIVKSSLEVVNGHNLALMG